MKKAIWVTLGLAAVASGALMLLPKKASASPLDGDTAPPEGEPVTPQNAAEAYSLGTNPKITDPEYVQRLATWLVSYGQRPDWAGTLQKRVYDLKAENLLAEGLKDTTTLERIKELATLLQPTHPVYAAVLSERYLVQAGSKPAPKPFVLELLSGCGQLNIDLSVFAPRSSGGGLVSPAGPTPGGSSSPAAATAAGATTPPAPSPPSGMGAAAAGTAASSGAAAAGTAAAATPLAAEEVKPGNDPRGTIALAQLLLSEQGKPNWKYVSPAVTDWQKRMGLTADGKFGPGSALMMAREVGVLPFVRYFSLGGSGTKAGALSDYRGRLKALALDIGKTAPEHAAALLRSADQETGLGWPVAVSKPAPIVVPTVEELEKYVRILESAIANARKAK